MEIYYVIYICIRIRVMDDLIRIDKSLIRYQQLELLYNF